MTPDRRWYGRAGLTLVLTLAACAKESPGRLMSKGEAASAAPLLEARQEAEEGRAGEGQAAGAAPAAVAAADGPSGNAVRLQGVGAGGGGRGGATEGDGSELVIGHGSGGMGFGRVVANNAAARPRAARSDGSVLPDEMESDRKAVHKNAEESEKKSVGGDDGVGWRDKAKEKVEARSRVRATGELAAAAPAERKPDAPRKEAVMAAQKAGDQDVSRELGDLDGHLDLPASPAPPTEEVQGEACTRDPAPPRPLPKRCHLAPNYFAGAAAWQRRLAALAELPPELAQLAARTPGGTDLQPPETSALSVSARLDRDHVAGPGLVWLRVALRSTDRWGMRRPPFDLAVAVGPQLASRGDDACKHLEAIASYLEPQDRLTVVVGAGQDPSDGIAGSEAVQRVRALCSSAPAIGQTALGDQHRTARRLLAAHAAAQHRVAGTRAVVLVGARSDVEDDGDLVASVTEAVAEPTLSSVVLAEPAATDTAWRLAELGHGLVALGSAGHETAGARALWQAWGRVVARLVRVDIRLAGTAVAHRVLGSRVLDEQETARVRRQERAVDANLARVAGVQRDRDHDGEGMTMLIPAFLGSDEHVIDLLVHVDGAGPVADVVVDYKDLVRMANQKAMARAALHDLPAQGARVAVQPPLPSPGDLRAIGQFRDAVAQGRAEGARHLLQAWQSGGGPAGFMALAGAMAPLVGPAERRPALLAAIEAWLAHARGCHVAAGSPSR